MEITAIFLTFNEELHLERCLAGIQKLTDKIFVVDSFSTYRRVEILKNKIIQFVQNKWINHSVQFQFSIDHSPYKTPWQLRIDADEYMDDVLIKNIKNKLLQLDPEIKGINFKRKIIFLGNPINHGGFYPMYILRMWRSGEAYVEQIGMDEHILMHSGRVIILDGDLIDHNLNNLGWWIQKHNNYATLMAIEYLISEESQEQYRKDFLNSLGSLQAKIKRLLRLYLYEKYPIVLRSRMYFIFRYILRLGFLDGYSGFFIHFLQAYWYRLLVDAKIFEIKKYSKEKDIRIKNSIKEIYNYDV